MNDQTNLSIVITTLPNSEAAATLGRHLIESKVAACVNIIPITNSIYQWEGKIVTAKEHYLIAKTTSDNKDSCVLSIKNNHPYTVPVVFAIDAELLNAAYFKWMQDCLNPQQELPPSEEDASKKA